MNKRLVWLAPLALAIVLAGCRVTVTTVGPLAPETLVGYKLTLTNDEGRGGRLPQQNASVRDLPVDLVITYYFWSETEARNPEIRVATSNWTYNRSGNKGTVRVVFPRNTLIDFITTCVLTFEDSYGGTHRCELEDKATGTIDQETVRFGWGEGEFELENL
ncbi:MAG: hypothetical protein OXJ90_18240 [Spirochaetaceae bacterium]|nr:hypothetical protein [Spirochaetaceae bacterium]